MTGALNAMEFGSTRPKRRPSLTPMIDVVFLLLVFFMLAARFGQDGAIATQLTGSGAGYSGPPRLVSVAEDRVRLNGFDVNLEALPREVAALMAGPQDLIVVRPQPGAPVQAMVDVLAVLQAAGLTQIAVVE